MRNLLHKIAHWLGSNTGEVDVFWLDGKLMVGFRCHGCGKLSGVHESHTYRSKA